MFINMYYSGFLQDCPHVAKIFWSFAFDVLQNQYPKAMKGCFWVSVGSDFRPAGLFGLINSTYGTHNTNDL